MSDQRNHGRQNTHDTGSPTARPRDDLRTASKKGKPNEERDEDRDRKENAEVDRERDEKDNEKDDTNG